MDALPTIFEQCAPQIDPRLMVSLVKRESAFNPYAIGLDGKAVLKAQPQNLKDAIKTVNELIAAKQNFSVGLAQIHISNVRRLGITWEQAFNACTNLRYGQQILQAFHLTALKAGYKDADAVFVALRGYNSGDINGAVSNGYATAIMSGVIANYRQPGQAVGSAASQVITLREYSSGNVSKALSNGVAGATASAVYGRTQQTDSNQQAPGSDAHDVFVAPPVKQIALPSQGGHASQSDQQTAPGTQDYFSSTSAQQRIASTGEPKEYFEY